VTVIPTSRLSLALLLAGLTAADARAQATPAPPAPRRIVGGMVTDSAGNPLDGALIVLLTRDVVSGSVRSANGGKFAIAGDMTSASSLLIRHLGYHPREVELSFPRDSAHMLTIMLLANPAQLEHIVVGASAPSGWMRGFYDRKNARSFGHFFSRAEIKARNPNHLTDILRSVPGLSLMPGRGGGVVVRLRGCRQAPMVWVDGQRAPRSELDDAVMVNDIEGLEIYASTAGVPAQFLDRSNAGCGTILVWTRQQ
jgi:hypothetical protein